MMQPSSPAISTGPQLLRSRRVRLPNTASTTNTPQATATATPSRPGVNAVTAPIHASAAPNSAEKPRNATRASRGRS